MRYSVPAMRFFNSHRQSMAQRAGTTQQPSIFVLGLQCNLAQPVPNQHAFQDHNYSPQCLREYPQKLFRTYAHLTDRSRTADKVTGLLMRALPSLPQSQALRMNNLKRRHGGSQYADHQPPALKPSQHSWTWATRPLSPPHPSQPPRVQISSGIRGRGSVASVERLESRLLVQTLRANTLPPLSCSLRRAASAQRSVV
jgi:hypothetical protein